MRVANLETGEDELLLTGMFGELTVAPDGSAVAYVQGNSHFSMKIAVQPLSVPVGDALPHTLGTPRDLTNANGYWHMHNGGWSPDSKAVVYTRDEDHGDIFLIDR